MVISCFILSLIAVILNKSSTLSFLASKRGDTGFRTRQVEVVDTSTEQLTFYSLLIPSNKILITHSNWHP